MGKRSRMKKLRRLVRPDIEAAVAEARRQIAQEPRNMRVVQNIPDDPDHIMVPSFRIMTPEESKEQAARMQKLKEEALAPGEVADPTKIFQTWEKKR